MQAHSHNNLNTQKWVAAVSVLLLAVKFIAYYYTASVAILTDALESIVNVVAGFIGLYSLFVAAKPRDQNHPYGHGKAEFISAAVEGTLIGIAGLVILYKAITQLIYPQPLQALDLGMLLVSITAIVNYILGWICIRQGKRSHSMALEVSGKHLQTDTYSTIAIVLGLALVYFTDIFWIDAALAILLSFYIIFSSYKILRRSIAGIMDEADQRLLTGLIHLLNTNRQPDWVDLHNLRVIKYGSILHIDCHVTVPWFITVKDAHEEIKKLGQLIKPVYGESVELFVHSDGCIPRQCLICNKKPCTERVHPFEHQVEWTPENVVQDKAHDVQTVS